MALNECWKHYHVIHVQDTGGLPTKEVQVATFVFAVQCTWIHAAEDQSKLMCTD